MNKYSFAAFLLAASGVDAFVPTVNPSSVSSTQLMMEPVTLGILSQLSVEPVTVGIAVASAAAGAAAQMPRIQALERELESTKAALDLSEQEMVSKIAELEDKLFNMDDEFEQQTAKFQKQYDQQKKKELEGTIAKLKTDMKYSMEIKLEEEKSKLLLDQVKSLSQQGDKQTELTQLKLKQSQVQETNLKLEKALVEAQDEVERMQGAAAQRAKFLGIF